MVKALTGNVYEVKKGSRLYEQTMFEFKEKPKLISHNFAKIAKSLGIDKDELVVFSDIFWGFSEEKGQKAIKKYESQLKKDAHRGVRIVKRNSNLFKQVKPQFEFLEKIDANVNEFLPHDVFGMNNFTQAQRIKNRIFYGVVDVKRIPDKGFFEDDDDISPVPDKDYLNLLTKAVNEQDGE